MISLSSKLIRPLVFLLAVFTLAPLVFAALPTPPPSLDSQVSFIKASCPTQIVNDALTKETKISVVYYKQGVLTCDNNVKLTVTEPVGNPSPTVTSSCNLLSNNVRVFTVSSLADGKYDVEADLTGSSLPKSKCSFTASFQKETPVPELSEWSLLAVLLGVFVFLGKFGGGKPAWLVEKNAGTQARKQRA